MMPNVFLVQHSKGDDLCIITEVLADLKDGEEKVTRGTNENTFFR